MTFFEPAYIAAKDTGVLKKKIAQANEILKSCVLCPRECRVNRLSGEKGICKTGANAVVSSAGPHFGEEAPLVGSGGSGTIFFSNCNLLCKFCQNFEISHLGQGSEAGPDAIASGMISLQESGCHNINFVTPSHVVPQILSAIDLAIEMGLRVPLVYNSSGYDSVNTLKLLDGIFDIYMPDFKFWDSTIANQACDAPDYPEKACLAIKQMHGQTGDFQINEKGIATHGLLVRHLVLPHGMAGTSQVMKFLADKISKNTYVNIMPQYRPCGRASEIAGFCDPITTKDYENALASAKAAGIHRLDQRRRVFALG